MPALPDVVIYLEALTRHIVEPRMERLVLHRAFVQRSADPPIDVIQPQRTPTRSFTRRACRRSSSRARCVVRPRSGSRGVRPLRPTTCDLSSYPAYWTYPTYLTHLTSPTCPRSCVYESLHIDL